MNSSPASSRRWIFPLLALIVAALVVWKSEPPEETEDLRPTDSPQNRESATPTGSPQDSAFVAPPPSAYKTPDQKDWIVSFARIEDLRAFQKAWQERFPDDRLQILSELRSLRVQTRDPSARVALRELLPDDAERLPNTRVRLPHGPDFSQIPPSHYQPFQEGLRSWLGAPENIGEWGGNVQIAVLDTGIKDWGRETSLSQLDLLSHIPLDEESGQHGRAVSLLMVGEEGLAPAADLFSVRVLDGRGEGDVFTVADGLIRAVDQGARVINLSLGTYEDNQLLREAVDYAHRRGAVLVAAAGNDGGESLPFPAAYPGVISVSAIDAERQHAHFSNRGPVDLAAPGVGVFLPWSDEQMLQISGTSASSPIVAGAIAGLLSQEPSLSPQEAAHRLIETADDAGPPGYDSQWGHGVLSLERALRHGQPGIHDPAIADFHLHPTPRPDGSFEATVSVQNRGTERSSGMLLEVQGADGSFSFSVPSLAPGKVEGFSLSLSPGDLARGDGLRLEAILQTPPGMPDENPENNRKAVDFQISPPED